MFMDCKRWHTATRLMFQRDSSACLNRFKEASTGSRKTGKELTGEKGLWMRSTGDLEREERLRDLMFADGGRMELGGLLDVGDEGERNRSQRGSFLTGPLGCCWYFLGDMVEGSDVGV